MRKHLAKLGGDECPRNQEHEEAENPERESALPGRLERCSIDDEQHDRDEDDRHIKRVQDARKHPRSDPLGGHYAVLRPHGHLSSWLPRGGPLSSTTQVLPSWTCVAKIRPAMLLRKGRSEQFIGWRTVHRPGGTALGIRRRWIGGCPQTGTDR